MSNLKSKRQKELAATAKKKSRYKGANKSHIIAEDEVIDYERETKSVRCEIRLTGQQQRSIEEAARILGFRNSTEYIRFTIQENARNVIREQSVLEIAERDRERFMREITNPESPRKALKDAAKYFQNTIGHK